MRWCNAGMPEFKSEPEPPSGFIFSLLFNLILGVGAVGCWPTHAAERVVVGAFSAGDFSGWDENSFKQHTSYQLRRDAQNGEMVLQAEAHGTASGQVKKIRIDLTKTPVLNWSWKIEQPYVGLNEESKGGDDFPVRVYVIAQRGLFGLATRAVNYVWASTKAVGQHWPNPYTAQAQMMALDSGSAGAGQWVMHKRNVRTDLQALFGIDITQIDAVALMTDGDNSGSNARASYGDIFFTER